MDSSGKLSGGIVCYLCEKNGVSTIIIDISETLGIFEGNG